MGFFQWVREGVREAVVLGFVDAVEDVGTRSREEDFGATLAQSLRERLAVKSEPTVIESAAPAKGRRRLGRSLEAMQKAG
jgi:hypothetical protein